MFCNAMGGCLQISQVSVTKDEGARSKVIRVTRG